MPTDTHQALPSPDGPSPQTSPDAEYTTPERRITKPRRAMDKYTPSPIDLIGNRFLFVITNFGVIGVMIILFWDMQRNNEERSRDDRTMFREEQQRQRTHDEVQRDLTRKELDLTRQEFRAALMEYRSSNNSLQSASAELRLTREALESMAKTLKANTPAKPKATTPMSSIIDGWLAPRPREVDDS